MKTLLRRGSSKSRKKNLNRKPAGFRASSKKGRLHVYGV
jgi:hypothetical protein